MAALFFRFAERKRDRDRQALAALASDYGDLFRSPAGQRVLAHILQRNRVFDTTFDATPTVAAFQEGKRRAALEILEMVNADPTAWQRMVDQDDTGALFDGT